MYNFFIRTTFVVGFLLGVFLAVLFRPNVPQKHHTNITGFDRDYQVWFGKQNLSKTYTPMDSIRYANTSLVTEAQYLYSNVKIVCVILVHKLKNAVAATETWARFCNDRVFINIQSLRGNKTNLPIKQIRSNSSWFLLCEIVRNMSAEFRWALFVNDDTFALLENLRFMVASLDYKKKYYLGHAITFWGVTYNVAQAGYVLSYGTIKALQEKFPTLQSCKAGGSFLKQEDYYLGKNLAELGIVPMDTRDSYGLSTFHGYNLQQLLFPGSLTTFANYYKNSVFPVSCCSKYSITFQTIEADKMHMYDYCLYKVQLFTSGHYGNRPIHIDDPDAVWKSFLHEQGINQTSISAQEYYKLWEKIVHDPTVFNQELRKQIDPE